MRSVSVRLADLSKVTIPIGFVGENLHTQVRIDCVKLFEDYPNAVPGLTVNPPMGDTYPAVVTRDGDYVIWDIEDSDLTVNGNGEIQLSFFVDEVIAKSYISRIRIEKSLVSTGDIPTPIENWIDEANEKLAEVEKWNNVTAEASTLAPGTSATVEITEENGHNKFEFGIPRGDKGDTGTPGFSPVIVVTDITGGHRVSITDVGGTHTVDIMDGEKGDTGNGIESAVLNQDYTLTLNFTDGTHYTTPSIRGAKGENGDTGNGIASVTLNQDYTLTITYTNGQSTTTASIRGEKGETGATPVISIGTVTTLQPGSDATASMDVTDPEHPVLSFGIPEGDPGEVTEAELNAVAESKADIIYDTASGAIASFPDGADNLPMSVTAEINPVQDLHGQDAPYPPGGGKNLLPAVLSSIKTINTDGTWNGNVYTVNNVVFTVNEDNDGNVISVNVNGTASLDSSLYLVSQYVFPAGSYILNGCPSGGSTSTYRIFATNFGSDTGSALSFTADGTTNTSIRIQIRSGTQVSNQIWKPMVRLSSVSDATFAPYSNICPISGWDSANVSRTGKNLVGITLSQESNNSIVSNVFSLKAGTYTLSVKYNGTPTWGLYLRNGNNSSSPVISQIYNSNTLTFTLEHDYEELCFSMYYGQGITLSEVTEIQIELGSTASAYEAYQGNVYPITFPSEAGTVYGGTLTVNKDGTGTLVAEYKYYENAGTGSWGEVTSGGNRWYIGGITQDALNSDTTGVCNIGKLISTFYENGVCVNKNGRINLCGSLYSAFSDVNALKAYLAEHPLQLVYKLATPVTYQLTNQQVIETLKGVNNVFADCGSVTVNYPCDTKLYIDKKVAELQALILES